MAGQVPIASDVAASLARAADSSQELVIIGMLRQRLRSLAVYMFVWMEAIAIALGLATYVGDPFGFLYPRLALWAILSMLAVAVVVRAVPALRRHAPMTRSLEVVALFIYATLLTLSMGAANSPFIALYAITLLAAALSWELWQVMALALVTLGVALLQADFMDLMDEMPLFAIAVIVVNALLPAVAASAIIATVRKIDRGR